MIEKLTRDKIPQIVESRGEKINWRIANEDEKMIFLKSKMLEEAHEFIADQNLEELCDLYEVMLKVLDMMGYTFEDMKKMADQKRSERGGFDNFVIMKYDKLPSTR